MRPARKHPGLLDLHSLMLRPLTEIEVPREETRMLSSTSESRTDYGNPLGLTLLTQQLLISTRVMWFKTHAFSGIIGWPVTYPGNSPIYE